MSACRLNDRRIQRSIGAMRVALGRLLRKEPYSQITVSDIAAEAGYGRATFYTHFTSKDDFVRRLVHDEVLDFFHVAYEYLRQHGNMIRYDDEYRLGLLTLMFQHIYERRETYWMLFSSEVLPGAESYFCQQACAEIRRTLELQLPQGPAQTDMQIFYVTTVASFFGFVRYWLEADCRQSPMYMADHYFRQHLQEGTTMTMRRAGRAMAQKPVHA